MKVIYVCLVLLTVFDINKTFSQEEQEIKVKPKTEVSIYPGVGIYNSENYNSLFGYSFGYFGVTGNFGGDVTTYWELNSDKRKVNYIGVSWLRSDLYLGGPFIIAGISASPLNFVARTTYFRGEKNDFHWDIKAGYNLLMDWDYGIYPLGLSISNEFTFQVMENVSLGINQVSLYNTDAFVYNAISFGVNSVLKVSI